MNKKNEILNIRKYSICPPYLTLMGFGCHYKIVFTYNNITITNLHLEGGRDCDQMLFMEFDHRYLNIIFR